MFPRRFRQINVDEVAVWTMTCKGPEIAEVAV